MTVDFSPPLLTLEAHQECISLSQGQYEQEE